MLTQLQLQHSSKRTPNEDMIAEYYRDKEVFLTGGSGYLQLKTSTYIYIISLGVLGRGIIEKLLRSTEVKTLYILLRAKKGISVDDRLASMKSGLVSNFL